MQYEPTQSAFEILADDEGSVTVGWVGERVLYARFSDGMSSNLGDKFATRLQTMIERSSSLSYYSDARALKHYDLLARTAFVRVVLANRKKFAELLMLTCSEGISPVARALTEVLGKPIEIVTDPSEFEARLLRVAPFANQKIGATPRAHRIRTERSMR